MRIRIQLFVSMRIRAGPKGSQSKVGFRSGKIIPEPNLSKKSRCDRIQIHNIGRSNPGYMVKLGNRESGNRGLMKNEYFLTSLKNVYFQAIEGQVPMGVPAIRPEGC
jgi:hypothetical protein